MDLFPKLIDFSFLVDECYGIPAQATCKNNTECMVRRYTGTILRVAIFVIQGQCMMIFFRLRYQWSSGNKMSELGNDPGCFTDFLTEAIFMIFPREVRINEYTKIFDLVFHF